MEFRILGPLEVVDRDRSIPLGGARQRALLALLLTRANELVSADRLIDELWGERPPRTAANALQFHVSQLRKALGSPEVIVTRGPGYLIQVAPDELDLLRFERLVREARSSSAEVAAPLLREALGLWRGPALSDLAYEAFAQAESVRLEELRLSALEQRLEADLELGRHAEAVAELEALVRSHPLRERPRAQLMLALYRSGRQVEALEVYQQARRTLVDELGIEPSHPLQELEKGILRQDRALDPTTAGTDGAATTPAPSTATRAILVVAQDVKQLDSLIAIAEPLAHRPPRELILAALVRPAGDLSTTNAALANRRRELVERGVATRVTAYTSPQPGADVVVLATEHDVDLLVTEATPQLLETGTPDGELTTILVDSPCDVALLAGSGRPGTGPVVTPFGGVEHDWSAIELAAWLAGSLGVGLRLLGTEAPPGPGRRDASRLLGRASLVVQQVVGIVTEPVLVPPGEEGVLAAARGAGVIVLGLSERWRSEGIGRARLAIAQGVSVPTLFVRCGLRPSGVAPSETFTRFTWTLASERQKPNGGVA